MITLLFYINKIADGGAERAIVNLTTALSEQNYNVILVTSFRTKDEYELGDKVERISLEDEQIQQSRLKKNFSRIKKLRELCMERQPQAVISFMTEPIMRAQIATIGLSVKNIVSVRCNPSMAYFGIKGFILGKVLLPLANGCVFQTREAQEWFPLRLQKKSKIIYNPVTLDFYEKKRETIKHKVVTCGRLSEEKNHEMLIRAFKRVLKEVPDAQLEIYGIGEMENKLQVLIDHMKLSGSVWLRGNIRDVPDILSEADLFVMSSDQEGLPNALMEAMAIGVPSISTDCPCGGPRELFGEELKDMLVPVGDVEALADKMIELLSDDEKRLHVGANMRKRAKMFRADVIGEQWVAYIEQLLIS